MGYLRTCNAVLPHMVAAGFGRVVNVSGQNAYLTASITGSVRNAAVVIASKALADSVAGTGVTVTASTRGWSRLTRPPSSRPGPPASRPRSRSQRWWPFSPHAPPQPCRARRSPSATASTGSPPSNLLRLLTSPPFTCSAFPLLGLRTACFPTAQTWDHARRMRIGPFAVDGSTTCPPCTMTTSPEATSRRAARRAGSISGRQASSPALSGSLPAGDVRSAATWRAASEGQTVAVRARASRSSRTTASSRRSVAVTPCRRQASLQERTSLPRSRQDRRSSIRRPQDRQVLSCGSTGMSPRGARCRPMCPACASARCRAPGARHTDGSVRPRCGGSSGTTCSPSGRAGPGSASRTCRCRRRCRPGWRGGRSRAARPSSPATA